MKALTRTLFLGKVWQHYEELPSTNALMQDWLFSAGRQTSIASQNPIENPQSLNLPISNLNPTSTNNQFPITNNQLTEGVLVTTFNQMAGRGQMGNVWLSEPHQNIAFSILLQPNFLLAREQFHLNKAIALAVHDFFETQISSKNNQNTEGGKNDNFRFQLSNSNPNQSLISQSPNLQSPISQSPISQSPISQSHNPPITIKWSNDLYIGDRKAAGILIENSLSGSYLQQSIVGIGLNINQLAFSKEINATSLAIETGRQFDLFDLVEQLALAIEWRYLSLKRHKKFDHIHAEYLSKLYRFEEDATFVYADGRPFRGKIIGVTEGGQLEILTAHNGIEQFGIKEVKFEI